jgi:hypothetical protein
MAAKSRWIIQGFHDPDIAVLNRSVPTPTTSDIPLALQMLASLKASIWVGDVKSAFTQGLTGQRPERLFATPPAGGIPGEDDDILIELLAEVYGLITGPPAWRKSLLTKFDELGFKRHPLAPCVVLKYEGDKLCGLIVIETDDLLGGGITDSFHEAVKELRRHFTFGKWVNLQSESCEYGGRSLRQNPDFSVTISMVRYLKQKAREITLARGRCKQPDDEATELEITAFRGLLGKLNWATREGMPNGSGDASLLSGKLPHPKVRDLQEANAALRRLLQAEATITIRSIPLERIRLVVVSDASLGNASGGNSQLAHLIGAADESILCGEEADFSLLCYKSHCMGRAASSTLMVEANALSEGLAEAEYVATWIGLARDEHFNMRERDNNNRKLQISSIMSSDDDALKYRVAAVVDAKSLYDNLHREQMTGAEKRAALEIAVIRDSLQSLGGVCRWIPHEQNAADALTKLRGNAARLLTLLRDARLKLTNESEELQNRAEYRERTGQRNPRPNQTTLNKSEKRSAQRAPPKTHKKKNKHSQPSSQESPRESLDEHVFVQENVQERPIQRGTFPDDAPRPWLGRDYRFVRYEEWVEWTKDTRFWLEELVPSPRIQELHTQARERHDEEQRQRRRYEQWYYHCWFNTTAPTMHTATPTSPDESHVGASGSFLPENPSASWLNELDY